MRRLFMGLLSLALLASAPARGDEPVFSGPQSGEKLPPFTMTGVFDESAGKKIDLVSTAGGKPILLGRVDDFRRIGIDLAGCSSDDRRPYPRGSSPPWTIR